MTDCYILLPSIILLMKGSHNISLYCSKFFCDFKFIKGSILNSKCTEGRGRSRLGGNRLGGEPVLFKRV